MTPPTCEWCGAPEPVGAEKGIPGDERYVRCRSCRHAHLQPMPTAERLAAYYNAQYQVPRNRHRARAQRAATHVRDIVAPHAPRAERVLEVGCSYGDVMMALRDHGWTTMGIELDDRAAAIGRSAGLDVRTGTVERALPPDERFDVVYAAHVVEHLPDPLGTVRRMADALTNDGCLVLRTPNAASLASRMLGSRWEWAAVPEHVHLFSPRSVALLLERAGLRVVHHTTRRGDAHPIAVELPLGLGRAMRRRGAGGGAPRHIHEQGRVPFTHRPVFRAVAAVASAVGLPLDAALQAGGLGEELEIVAVRAS
jgi:2-polyprenyl-3-methyl-5-hydroxy-6-metoxy-1,4-benzoquinol methylase